MKKIIKLLFSHLSFALIFTLTLAVSSFVKAAQHPDIFWKSEVLLKQQRQQPPNQKPPNQKPPNQKPPNQKPPNSERTSQMIRFILPPKGAPGNRTPAAARTGCPIVKKPMTALVPPTNIGLTISEHPTFWFYIPYQPTSANQIEFLLINDNKGYKIPWQLTGKPGIISITLPKNKPVLEIGKKYNWVLNFICNPDNRLQDAVVKGYIERVSINSNLKNQLERVNTLRERILLFAEHGLWYDALTLLGEERRKKPKDVQVAKDWQDLLQSPKVELQEIVLEPIVSAQSL